MELPKRKPIRLSGYDYSQCGYYFVTICTQNRECIFGSIVGADQCVRPISDQCVRPSMNNLMKLNGIGKMVNKWLIKIPEHFVGSSLDIYQIMPNHVHVIIVVEHPNIGSTHGSIDGRTHWSAPTGKPTTIGTIVQWFKTMSTNKYINGVKKYHWPLFNKRLWQRNYYEHIIRNEKELFKIREYIKINPEMWERDRNNPISLKTNLSF